MTLLILLGCRDRDGGDTALAWEPELHCPGDPNADCDDNDGQLRAGASSVSLVPPCFESWADVDGDGEWSKTTDGWLDCGCDQVCPEDEGWTVADEGEADGVFQATWLAGFSNGRPAQGVADGVWARTLVLRQGETAMAIISVDLVGFMHDDVLRVRQEAADRGLDIDHILVSSTHTHEGPDTVGLWGERIGKSGYQPEYVQWVREQMLAGIEEALEDEREVATSTLGGVDVREYHPERGSANVIRDTRDPVVLPYELGVLHLADSSGETIATVVHWGCHPETLASDNLLISSDFVHYLRTTVESGSAWDAYSREGVGGTAIYLQGMVGGMMTTLRLTTETPDGDDLSGATWEHTEAVGVLLGEMALDAIEQGEAISPSLSFEHSEFKLPVMNIGFQAMFTIGVITRELYDYDPEATIDDDNRPRVLTDMDHISLGDLELLSMPGELFPEAALGGYDGSLTGSDLYDIVTEGNENPPDLDLAPEGPYIADGMSAPNKWIVGLGNDELGYIIPSFNFELHERSPYLDEAEGDHYEETNSLGPDTEALVSEQADRLLSWSP
ncbi:MAG TPA: hypothetical protein QGF58_29075 [Myxococcota bacterium]|nr:hypothetical protein [Myxococcota bacterium]